MEDTLQIIILSAGGLLLCSLVFITILLAKLSRLKETNIRLEEQVKKLPLLEEEVSYVGDLKSEISRLGTQLEGERKVNTEKLKLLEEAKKTLSDSFKALSSDALKSNNQSFLELASQSFAKLSSGSKLELEKKEQAISELVKPLKESLSKVDEKIHTLEKSRVSAYQSITEQLKAQQDVVLRLKTETSSLSKALRAPSVRGKWGEMQLRKVVELAGMTQYCDFVEQQSTAGGKPDMVVKLPGKKEVIIDAKAPLQSYLEALECTDDLKRNELLKNHSRHVRDHIKTLGSKDYWKQFHSTPEFVVLFLPGEIFFSAALEKDPSLIDFGVEQKVILSTPTTLIALLKAVAYGWHQQDITENAYHVSTLGKELFDRIYVLAGHFEALRKSIAGVNSNFNKAVGSLEKNVFTSARKLQELGISKSADLPQPEYIESEPRTLSKIADKESIA